LRAGAVDFLKPQRPPILGWVLFALGAAALAVAVQADQRWAMERADREAQHRADSEAAERRQREAQRPVLPSPGQRRMQSVAPQLRQPWLPALRVIEGVTKPPVYLLALVFDPDGGTIRLDAEAGTFEQAVNYAASLQLDGVLGVGELRSHEQAIDPQGRPVVRFTIAAPWSTR
jgi:hypothetical protein